MKIKSIKNMDNIFLSLNGKNSRFFGSKVFFIFQNWTKKMSKNQK